MITPPYARVMAAYNSEMNRRLYAAAERLGEERRREGAGAFWNTLHGTLSHILWADRLWMSRFADGPKPPVGMDQSDRMAADFADLKAQREDADRFIEAWAEGLGEDWLASDVAWFSMVLEREVRAPAALLVTHFFNHQTHHRGQAHALITRFGEKAGDTDLFLVVPPDKVAEIL